MLDIVKLSWHQNVAELLEYVKFVEVNVLYKKILTDWTFCSRTMCRLELQRQEKFLSKLPCRPTCRCSTKVQLFMLLKQQSIVREVFRITRYSPTYLSHCEYTDSTLTANIT